MLLAVTVDASLGTLATLTRRELFLLQRVADSATYSAIASDFGVGEGAVKMRMRRILLKTGCDNRTHLVVQAMRHGLVK